MKKLAAMMFAFVMMFSVSVSAVDYPISEWARESVHEAIQAGLVPANLQGRYTEAITRAEFTALGVALVETVTNAEITERMDFNDTTDVNVRKMGALGVVSGVGGGRFDPHGTLTREQAAVMLSQLMNVLSDYMPSLAVIEAPFFADSADFSTWSVGSIAAVYSAGIMSGVGGNRFSPQGTYTREQSIATVLRLYNRASVASVEEVPAEVPVEAIVEEEETMLVALTIDDGPFLWTNQMLDVLAEYDVTATFFLIGGHIRRNTESAQAIFEAGHELANHTWNHVNLGSAELDVVREELESTSEAIREITGEYPVFFRAPFLSVGENLRTVTAEMGMAIISADADGNDWQDITPEQVAQNVLRNARDGSIILLHEQFSRTNTRTLEALPLIIADLRERGYEIVSLGELLRRRDAELVAGAVYRRVN
jgi:peptidoglycan/xylan/chitin deacetylase (PgdA/CDA1 family)